MRVLRRFALLLLALLLPLYAVSLSERLAIPAQWRTIEIGDGHAEVRERLQAANLGDQYCEWRASARSVRCTLLGRHHAAGVVIRFDAAASDARVTGVVIREPVYTGPFHWHARLSGPPAGGVR